MTVHMQKRRLSLRTFRWQTSQTHQARQSRHFHLKGWGMLVAGLLLVGFLVYAYRALASGVWIEGERFNFVVGREGGSLAVVSVPEKGPVLVLYLDPAVMMQTVYGYGEYKASSLLSLGKLEKKGTTLLIGSLEQTLGMKIHDYISYDISDPEQLNLSFLRSLVRPMLMAVIGHPVGVTDVYRYFKALSYLRTDQVLVMRVHESRLAVAETLPDNSVVYRLDTARLDTYLRDTIPNYLFSQENVGVAIVNTTAHSGLATALSRLLLNSGIDVVTVGENQDRLEKSTILVSPQATKTQSTDYIARFLPFPLKVDEMVTDFRADVVILLGEDYHRYLSEKSQ